MSLQPILTHGIFQKVMRGTESVKISIDISKQLDDYTVIEFSILEQSKHIKTITHIFMRYFASHRQLLSILNATLIENYMQNGNHFGLAVSQTINRHFPNQPVQSHISLNMLQKQATLI
jgi:hypothetical protein